MVERDIFFTKVETGDIKFIVRGDSLFKIIHDVPGKRLVLDPVDNNMMFVDGVEKKSYLNSEYGMWWIGFPPFSKIHSFWIKPERENPSGKESEDWIQSDPKRQVWSLRFAFPRPFSIQKVELKDRLSVDVLAVAKFEVVKPQIPVFQFKGSFFENAGLILQAQVNDILNNMTLSEFIPAPKGEVDGILKSMKEPPESTGIAPKKNKKEKEHDLGAFNRELIHQVGLKLVGISIPKYDPSDKDTLEAMQAKELATKKGEGRIAEADANAKVTIANANAKATAEERLAQARGARIRETIAALASSGGDNNIVTQQGGKILQAEALTGENSKINTWVDGSAGAQPVLSVGGDKK